MPDRPALYDPFARFYDLYWGDYYLDEARDGFERILLPLIPAGGRVLDLCCGVGRLAGWLADKGFDVAGLDASQAMLAHARRAAPQVEFIQADARGWVAEKPFDAVVSTFDSVNHFPSMEDLRKIFSNVAASLRPGGIFFFDVNTEAGFEYAADDVFSAVEDDHVCLVRSSYDAESGVGESAATLFELIDGEWRRCDVTIPEYLHETEDIRAALEQSGLAVEEVFQADEDLGMPRAKGRIFFLARRTNEA